MAWAKNFFVPSKIGNDFAPRLLTFNCHETWVHRLEHLGYPMDIIDGLPGRSKGASRSPKFRPCLPGMGVKNEALLLLHHLIASSLTT
jgi:hypothetical protein